MGIFTCNSTELSLSCFGMIKHGARSQGLRRQKVVALSILSQLPLTPVHWKTTNNCPRVSWSPSPAPLSALGRGPTQAGSLRGSVGIVTLPWHRDITQSPAIRWSLADLQPHPQGELQERTNLSPLASPADGHGMIFLPWLLQH